LLSFSGEPYEFIPLEWLKKWLEDSTATKEIDNSLFLCSHGKLHPDKVADAKRVSLEAAQLLYERYSGGPRMDGQSNRGFALFSNHELLKIYPTINFKNYFILNMSIFTQSTMGCLCRPFTIAQ